MTRLLEDALIIAIGVALAAVLALWLLGGEDGCGDPAAPAPSITLTSQGDPS